MTVKALPLLGWKTSAQVVHAVVDQLLTTNPDDSLVGFHDFVSFVALGITIPKLDAFGIQHGSRSRRNLLDRRRFSAFDDLSSLGTNPFGARLASGVARG